MGKGTKKELTSVETQVPSVEETQNVKALTHLLMIKEMSKPNLNDKTQVRLACEQYVLLCGKNDQKPLVSGLALALGITRKNLIDIVQGKEKYEGREIIEEYFGMLEAYDEQLLKEGKGSAIGQIFLGKNNYGYTDGVKLEVVHEEASNDEIFEKYKDRVKILKGENVEAVKKDDY